MLRGAIVFAFKSEDECNNGYDGIVGAMRLELSALLVPQNKLFVLLCT